MPAAISLVVINIYVKVVVVSFVVCSIHGVGTVGGGPLCDRMVDNEEVISG